MRKIFLYIIIVLISQKSFAQTTKVAIVDFENTSGKIEYDALGKAISSMLITDLANNIHPKKVEFYERSQLNKLLDEQKLQKSKNFNAKTAVDFGKLSGVTYVLVGAVFVMDKTCVVTSNLVEVQTSKILLSKDISGNIEDFLKLKSQLAYAISRQLNNPITLNPSYTDQNISLATLNQYGKIINTMDGGDMEKAEQMRSLFEETNPDFKYFKDIKEDIEKLKQRVSELENVTEVLTDAFDLGDKAEMKKDYKSAIKFFNKFLIAPGNKGFTENKKLYAYSKLAKSQYLLGEYPSALDNSQKAQLIYKFYPEANETELMALIQLKRNADAEKKYSFIIDSLIIVNELDFRKQKRNDSLVWESIDGLYYGLPSEAGSDELLYSSIRNHGYGSPPENEIEIKKELEKNSLMLKASSQYENLEAKLLSYNDSLIFSSDQILNFYKLSLVYAEQLKIEGSYEKYKSHLKKEIKRMEKFGIKCPSCNVDMRIPLGPSANKSEHKKWEESREIMWSLGLSNSMDEFDKDFKIVYGKFIYKYLILLIKENKTQEAAQLYRRIMKGTVIERESYFYSYYWDIILELRIITVEWDTKTQLSASTFEKKLEIKIQKDLNKEKIPLSIWEKVIKEKINFNSGSTEVELDTNLVTSSLIGSKNIGVIEDALGNKILQANEENISDLTAASKPAFCYYDFDESNGEKYGKLYNYWALKLIERNPPKGWRIADQKDYAKLLGGDEPQIKKKGYFVILKLLCASGERHINGFSGIDKGSRFWTSETFKVSNLEYYKIVNLWVDGKIQKVSFGGTIIGTECFLSIRLVKEK